MSRLASLGLLFALFLLAARPSAAQETSAQAAAREHLKPALQSRLVLSDTLLQFRTELRPSSRIDLDDNIIRAEYDVATRVEPQLAPEAAARSYLRAAPARFGLVDPDEELIVERVMRGHRSSHVTFQQVFEGIPVYNRHVIISLDADGQPTLVINGVAAHLGEATRLSTMPTIAATDAVARVEAAGVDDLETTTPELVVYPSKPARLAWLLTAWPRQGVVEWEVLVDAHSGEVIQMLDLSPHAHRPAAGGSLRHDSAGTEAAPAAGPRPPGTTAETAFPLVSTAAGAETASPLVSTAAGAETASPLVPTAAGAETAFPLVPTAAGAETAFPLVSTAAGAETTSLLVSTSAPRRSSIISVVDGTGAVFDPDPITTAGVSYGAPYVDDGDSDIPELNAERRQVTLRDISQGTDGLYRLEGPYVIIDDGTRGDPYSPPAESSPDAFQYTRANDYFEAVMSYYHVDKSQRYVQSLDVGFDIKNEPVLVNPQAYTDDNSLFLPAHNILVFGTGGIDDAEDADVIWHEYAHALLHFTQPGLLSTFNGKALHEGWSDYWAASYSRFLSEEDPEIPAHDWWRVFTWDGNLPCWPGRSLDHPGSYPDDTDYPTSGCVGYTAEYEHGMLWATTLMEIYDDLGRDITDRLNLASHAYLSSSTTFPDAAQAMIQADEDLYGGVHANVMIERFGARGYVDPSIYGPVLTHEPLEATEDLGGEVRIEVTAVGASAPVDSVLVYYGSEEDQSERIELHPAGGNEYAGDLPVPSEPMDVHYYVEAVDEEGRRRRLPGGAPVETFSFRAGPDAEPPTIAHDAPLNVSVVGWPMDVYAEVRDNIGVDSVWVEYAIQGASGQTQAEGAFGLTNTGEAHFGTFPATAHKVQEGESVSYRLFARDVSSAGNVTVSPEEGFYHVSVVDQGVLRAYDFEGLGQGLHAEGIWRRGTPEYGLRIAHSGENVWATNPSTSYTESAQLSSLELPPVNVDGIETTYLVFWHWYDLEHEGEAVPGAFDADADLRDGANVKVSTDGGATWDVLEPEDGYNGMIGERYDNPLGGQPGFGAYSYGWRREIVPLPEASDLRIRFDFGTDDGNREDALYFAGWHLDDVSITTNYPEDQLPPTATDLPERETILIPDQEDIPSIAVTVDDDTGIEAVISRYRFVTAAGEETGSIRLAMSTTDRSVYAGNVAPVESFAPGDRIEYTLLIRDFDGNESEYPEAGGSYVVDVRASQQSNALTSVIATGTWHRQGGSWAGFASETAEPVSSLVLEPFILPANGDRASFVLQHRYEFSGGLGGNVKISTDDARSWSVLAPEGGYASSLESDGTHRMEGEDIFAGSSDGMPTSTFDLSQYDGQEIRLRLDFATSGPATANSEWFVDGASYRVLSPDDVFETPFDLDLHANFPNPFADRTTISYSVPERTPVRLTVYDMLGRRVALVRHVVQEAGIYTVQFDGSHLASGVYMLYLETQNGTRTQRMVVAR